MAPNGCLIPIRRYLLLEMAESAVGPTGRIFISYRRDETAYPAGWLYDRLAQHFGAGQIFKDVDSIELGDDFVQVITRAVGSCDVLLALIGEQWLTITDAQGQRRLNDPDDFVRLEIEAALTRDVRIIPILIDGARMPNADELPTGLASLARRQALELSPSRFEYDTSRLLKILDMTLAEVRTAHDGPAPTSSPVAQQALANTAEEASSATGSTRDSNRSGRGRTVRRVVMIGVPLVAVLIIYFIIQVVLDKPTRPPNNDSAQSLAGNEIRQDAPWRLIVRNDGSDTGCTVKLINRDSNETWSNEYPVWETASFVIPRTGNFQWSAESACTVLSRSGPGNLTLPAVVDGVGTSDAFKPPKMITVKVKDFHGNQRCAVELLDATTGTVVDIAELNQQKDRATLQPEQRPLVFLVNDACAVQVSPG
jgi:TIR domain